VGGDLLDDPPDHRGEAGQVEVLEVDAGLLLEPAHGGVPQAALVAEVAEDGALADPGPFGDRPHGDALPIPDRRLCEERARRLDDAVAGGVGLLPPDGAVVAPPGRRGGGHATRMGRVS